MPPRVHEELDGETHQGVKCLDCSSVIFDVESLIQHLLDRPGHRLFTSGDDVVLSIDCLADVDPQIASELQHLRDQHTDEGGDA